VPVEGTLSGFARGPTPLTPPLRIVEQFASTGPSISVVLILSERPVDHEPAKQFRSELHGTL
jgi:hypothetical protein